MYQEYIPHTEEIRVYVVGDNIISYSIRDKKTANQLWISPASIKIRPAVLPQALKTTIKRFQRLMKFDYGAIDLLHDSADDKYTFLEINLDGDWNYFDKQSHASSLVRKAVDDFLTVRFRQ